MKHFPAIKNIEKLRNSHDLAKESTALLSQCQLQHRCKSPAMRSTLLVMGRRDTGMDFTNDLLGQFPYFTSL